MIYRCTNDTAWHPSLHTIQKHHHPPLSWRRDILRADPNADQSWWRIIPLCGLDHDESHTLLNAYVRTGDTPPWTQRRTYSPFVRSLAAECWARRVRTQRMPYTESRRHHEHDL